MITKPTDDEILAVLKDKNPMATYVVRNWLSSAECPVDTPWVLRRLKALERDGKVERVRSAYAVMYVWKLALKSADGAGAKG